MNETGRPVLLITRTAEAAEYFSKVFFQMDIPNNLLYPFGKILLKSIQPLQQFSL
jgi:preprotein translocase subunit SecA